MTPQSLRKSESARHQRRDRLCGDTNLAAVYAPRRADLLEDVLDDVGRRRETQTLVPAGLRQDERIDADDVAGSIDERAAAIARIDRRVRLDVNHRVLGLELPRDGAHDAHRDGVLEAEGASEREHDLARTERIRIAELEKRQVAFVRLENREVRLEIDTDDLRTDEAPARPENGAAGARRLRDQDPDPMGARRDVRVGHDVAVRAQNHARSATPLLRDELMRGNETAAGAVAAHQDLYDGGVDPDGELFERIADVVEAQPLRLRRKKSF